MRHQSKKNDVNREEERGERFGLDIEILKNNKVMVMKCQGQTRGAHRKESGEKEDCLKVKCNETKEMG